MFKLQDDKNCVAVTITDCVENDATKATDTCTRCKAGKKLVNNKCDTD